ncbi:hypothetical protein N7539_002099 [Penicillium diatomitis]|uniref:Uncharacterized protein n=1 Tax=Penicillium diatomitis TaxID=2819901 RepID=A0A9W9XHZ5_9EURO|nr:uncharacterized protein N7539_002099 [Penicillium diatomitis]KAJ5493353.1 hypothetical protein N7539_002099 [Penicillium diatomitis]
MTSDPPKRSLLADPAYLEIIDKLFACNVGEYISLPQLVVVGDQSSGKSSVLEGLTKLSFPRDSGLCTRFATQIIFRRETHMSKRDIEVSIIPSSDLEAADADKLRAWKRSGAEALEQKDFVSMMKEVHELMGLSSSPNDGKPTFSNSVLRLQISGPEEEHLSVIDVPGIFKNTTPGLTTKEDITMVRNMVLRYMENPRSIMLTVVPANVDIATQEIVELAKEYDPTGERTLGILTKPDLVDKGAESRIISFLESQATTVKLGWIVVRNPGQQQLDNPQTDRDAEERTFFMSSPWNQLPPGCFGINALRDRLQELHSSITRREFPAVRIELGKKLASSRDALQTLGKERETAEQQRQLLLDVISNFQQIVQHALAANYGSLKAFDDPDLRLATLIVSRNISFAQDFLTRGHIYAFQTGCSQEDVSPDSEAPNENEILATPPSPTPESIQDSLNPSEPAAQPTSNSTRQTGGCEALQDILSADEEIECSVISGINSWISQLYRDSKGFEIGTFNHNLLSTLMRRQSAKWPALVHGYVSDIIVYVHTFLQKALLASCSDRQLSTNVLSLMMDELVERYRRAISAADFLLDIERAGTPMTLNHYLNDNLQRSRQERLQKELSNKVFTSKHHGPAIQLSDLQQQSHMSNSEHTVQDIHDILRAYYKVSCKRFIDNICMQASDHHLITGPRSPLRLFNPSWVISLSDSSLERLAGESTATKRRRLQLRKEVQDLENGRRALMG